jgi:two-component system LytT family response regulator
MSLQNEINKMTAIIVDDEFHGRENLRLIIETYCPEIDIKDCASSVISAIEMVKIQKPEVVFLDINMPMLDGFDFLNEFECRDFLVVFVSAHQEYGINAVKANAFDYLLKPINIKELKVCVKKLLHYKEQKEASKISTKNNNLVIPSSHGFEVLHIDDILRLEADGCYTKIITKDKKTSFVSRILKDFELSLPKETFFRVHKSHLINLKYIKNYSNLSGGFVTMIDNCKVEISRRKSSEFLHQVKLFLKVL